MINSPVRVSTRVEPEPKSICAASPGAKSRCMVGLWHTRLDAVDEAVHRRIAACHSRDCAPGPDGWLWSGCPAQPIASPARDTGRRWTGRPHARAVDRSPTPTRHLPARVSRIQPAPGLSQLAQGLGLGTTNQTGLGQCTVVLIDGKPASREHLSTPFLAQSGFRFEHLLQVLDE